MKKILLSQNLFTLVDDEDFYELSKYKWMAKKDKDNIYAARHSTGGTRKLLFIHRILMETPIGMQTDHIDGDGLNNQKKNLRVCTNQQNQFNRNKNKNNTSGYKGVYWFPETKKWRAMIFIGRKSHSLGLFKNKEEAAEAYKVASLKYHREYAHENKD